MKPLFSRNISNTGRLVRGVGALALFLGADIGSFFSIWLGVALAVSGMFVLFEALRGWCLLRACAGKARLAENGGRIASAPATDDALVTCLKPFHSDDFVGPAGWLDTTEIGDGLATLGITRGHDVPFKLSLSG